MDYSIDDLKLFYRQFKFPDDFDEIAVCHQLGYYLPDNLPQKRLMRKGFDSDNKPPFITKSISSIVTRSKGESDFLAIFDEYKVVFRDALTEFEQQGKPRHQLVNSARFKANTWLRNYSYK